MDMAFDLGGLAPGWRGDGDAVRIVHPSWPELLARLIAAREASAALARQIRIRTVAMHGCFDPRVAASLVAHQRSHRFVNPNDLGNRKSAEAIASSVAGLSKTGGRG